MSLTSQAAVMMVQQIPYTLRSLQNFLSTCSLLLYLISKTGDSSARADIGQSQSAALISAGSDEEPFDACAT